MKKINRGRIKVQPPNFSTIKNKKPCDTDATSGLTKYGYLEEESDCSLRAAEDFDLFNELLFNHLTQNKWILNSSQKSQL